VARSFTERAIFLDEGVTRVGLSAVDLNFLIKTAASGVAIALLVGLAAWARVARSTPDLDEASVRELLAFEHPDARIGAIWISADARGALVRAGDDAIIVFRLGDGYVARSAPWTTLATTAPKNGAVNLRVADVGARLKLNDGAAWPPRLEAAA